MSSEVTVKKCRKNLKASVACAVLAVKVMQKSCMTELFPLRRLNKNLRQQISTYYGKT